MKSYSNACIRNGLGRSSGIVIAWGMPNRLEWDDIDSEIRKRIWRGRGTVVGWALYLQGE